MSTEESVKLTNLQRPVDLIDIAQRRGPAGPKSKDAGSFRDMFSAELAKEHQVQFSQHAHQRLHSRGLELTDDALGRLSEGIDRAQGKGSQETLVLTDEAAFVVSVPNRTVITVFDRDNLREGVVTQIDSAVIV
jgi:flagellar operon protein